MLCLNKQAARGFESRAERRRESAKGRDRPGSVNREQEPKEPGRKRAASAVDASSTHRDHRIGRVSARSPTPQHSHSTPQFPPNLPRKPQLHLCPPKHAPAARSTLLTSKFALFSKLQLQALQIFVNYLISCIFNQ